MCVAHSFRGKPGPTCVPTHFGVCVLSKLSVYSVSFKKRRLALKIVVFSCQCCRRRVCRFDRKRMPMLAVVSRCKSEQIKPLICFETWKQVGSARRFHLDNRCVHFLLVLLSFLSFSCSCCRETHWLCVCPCSDNSPNNFQLVPACPALPVSQPQNLQHHNSSLVWPSQVCRWTRVLGESLPAVVVVVWDCDLTGVCPYSTGTPAGWHIVWQLSPHPITRTATQWHVRVGLVSWCVASSTPSERKKVIKRNARGSSTSLREKKLKRRRAGRTESAHIRGISHLEWTWEDEELWRFGESRQNSFFVLFFFLFHHPPTHSTSPSHPSVICGDSRSVMSQSVQVDAHSIDTPPVADPLSLDTLSSHLVCHPNCFGAKIKSLIQSSFSFL